METSTRTGAVVFTLIAAFMYWLAYDQRDSGDVWFWIINIANSCTIKALGLWIKGYVQRTNPGNDRKVCFRVSSAVLAGLILLVILAPLGLKGALGAMILVLVLGPAALAVWVLDLILMLADR